VTSRLNDVASSDWLSVGELSDDTWHVLEQWKGATWPNEGLPRGTRLFDVGSIFGLLKSSWRPRGSTPGPPLH